MDDWLFSLKKNNHGGLLKIHICDITMDQNSFQTPYNQSKNKEENEKTMEKILSMHDV